MFHLSSFVRSFFFFFGYKNLLRYSQLTESNA